jgi:hypothetical protein
VEFEEGREDGVEVREGINAKFIQLRQAVATPKPVV